MGAGHSDADASLPVTVVIEAVIPVVIAARLVSVVRRKYVSALLSQEMAWYDQTNVSESLASFTETSSTMQTGSEYY